MDGCPWRENQSEHERINNHIRAAILEGEAAGAKVVGLGALNKAEFLNAGGSIFVKEMPHLKTRVVHGNTLTTAVILRTLPKNLSEVRDLAVLPALPTHQAVTATGYNLPLSACSIPGVPDRCHQQDWQGDCAVPVCTRGEGEHAHAIGGAVRGVGGAS